MTKRAYKVVGSRVVSGSRPGDTAYLDDKAVNIPALIEAGHIEPVRKTTAKAPVVVKDDKEGAE